MSHKHWVVSSAQFSFPTKIQRLSTIRVQRLPDVTLTSGASWERVIVLDIITRFWLFSVVLQVGGGMAVSGGGLPDVYHTIQLHFHWGGPATNGSEHTVDRRRYPMEVQYGQ